VAVDGVRRLAVGDPGGRLRRAVVGLFRFELTEVSGAPVLGTGIALLSLPLGERSVGLLLPGLAAGARHHRGIRVSAFNTFYGTMSLGPLSVDHRRAGDGAERLRPLRLRRNPVAGETSLVRVDLGAPLDDQGHYAWAPDLVFPDFATWTEAPTSIAFGPTAGRRSG
jgi:hypothetical protein